MGLYGKKYKLNDLTVRAFLALTAAGLWGEGRTCAGLGVKESCQNGIDWKEVDWDAVMQLAREQALVGILASAFDAGEGGSVAPGLGFELQEVLSREQRKAFAKKVYSLEQHNQKQGEFIGRLAQWLETNGISPVLLKGQGVAKSYRIPWRRTPGDIDLLFQSAEYEKAKQLLSPKAVKVMQEGKYEKQLQMFFGKAIVELHGTMRVSLSKKIDAYLDSEMERMFTSGDFMHLSCICSEKTSGQEVQNQQIQVRIPPVQLHAVYVFLHILEHLFHSGIGLRQVCDLARLLHVHRDEIDGEKLLSDIDSLGVMDEWNAFSALMFNYLGMRIEDIPLKESADLGPKSRWSQKAGKLLAFILSTGNMGKNRDLSYRRKSPYLVKKAKTLWFIAGNAIRLGAIFPKNAALISVKGLGEGMKDLAEGK